MSPLLPLAAALTILLAPLPALGQAGGEARSLTLEEAVALALGHNPSLQAQELAVGSARAAEVTAGLRPNPTFSNETQDFTTAVSWPIELGGKRERRQESARLASEGAGFDLADARRTLVLSVRTAFVGALAAKANLAAAEESLQAFRQVVELNRVRSDKGEISGGDLLKTELQLLQFETDLGDATAGLATAKTTLRQLLAAPELEPGFDPSGDLRGAPPVDQPLAELIARAQTNRPDLLSARAGERKAQADLRLAEANAKADVTLVAGWSHAGRSFGPNWVQPFFPKGAESDTIGTGISFPLRLFDRNQGEIARMRSEASRAARQADAAGNQVTADVETALAAYRASRGRVELYERTYLQKARQSREIAEYAYKKGATSILDLLDAERTDRALQLAYRQALADLLISFYRLEATVAQELAGP